jgi:hypothetical protein
MLPQQERFGEHAMSARMQYTGWYEACIAFADAGVLFVLSARGRHRAHPEWSGDRHRRRR